MNNNLKITVTVAYNDGDVETEMHRESEGTILDVKAAFEAAEENLGKLERAVIEWVGRGEVQANDNG